MGRIEEYQGRLSIFINLLFECTFLNGVLYIIQLIQIFVGAMMEEIIVELCIFSEGLETEYNINPFVQVIWDKLTF